MQMLMTLASRVNKSRIVPPKFKTIKLRKRLVTAARPRQMRTLFDTVVFSGAEILPGEGRDGNTVSTHNHPENTVHFSVSGPGGDGVGSEGVDGRLDQQVGNRIHCGLQTGRQTDFDDIK